MERTRRTRALAVAVVAVPLLAACSSGFNATSLQPYAPADGILVDNGDLRIQNALVVSSPSATSGVVSAAIANNGDRPDRLTGVTSPDGQVDLTGSGALPPGGSLPLGADTGTSATITGLKKLAGETITLRLTFRRADPVTFTTVVVPATGGYATITPGPTASAG